MISSSYTRQCRKSDWMQVNAKHIFFFFSAIFLISLFYPSLAYFIKPLVKILYEGTSLGKSYAFLGWLVLFFGALAVKERVNFSPQGKDYSSKFLRLAFAGYLVAALLQVLLFISYSGSLPTPFSTIATMSSSGNEGSWEASYFGHLHSSKFSLFFLNFQPFKFVAADDGMPFFQIMPFALPLAIIIWILIFFLVKNSLLEALSSPKIISLKNFIWAIASWGVIVTVIDGGPFTPAGQFAILLLLFYSAFFKKQLSNNLSPAFFLSLLIFSAAFNYFFGKAMPIYGLALASAFCLLILFLASKKKELKLFFLLLFAAFALIFYAQASPFFFEKSIEEGKEATLFIYGIPLDSNPESLESALLEKFQNPKIYSYGYIAIVEGVPSENFTLSSFSSFIKERMNAKGYLETVLIEGKGINLEISSAKNQGILKECNSSYLSFEQGKGKAQSTKSILPQNYAALYALNCLLMNNGKNPVVIANGNTYI